MSPQLLEKYIRNTEIILSETGTYDDFQEFKSKILEMEDVEQNLILVFALGFFAANQYYTDEIKQLLKERKLELKLSEVHSIVKEVSTRPLC